jgi:acyl-CoA thioester hydrolase
MLKSNNFSAQYRVYYEDTDAGGVVYYANYLKFAERARTEMLRAKGIDQSDLLSHDHLCFVVRKVEAEYLSPARLDDLVTIHTKITALGGASLEMQQKITKEHQLLVTLKVLVVAVNSVSMKPTRIPERLRGALTA